MRAADHFSPSSIVVVLACLAATLSAPARAHGQDCYEWIRGEGLEGATGSVRALTTWDPDRLGPEPSLLVAGGDFQLPGDVVTHNIAAWDGTNWSPVGGGMTDNAWVHALAVYDGKLIAGGTFYAAGGVSANHIAQWDGENWDLSAIGICRRPRACTSPRDRGAG